MRLRSPFLFSVGLIVLVSSGVISSCSEPEPPKPLDTVVVNYHDWVKDGASTSWALGPGRFKVEMTASADGAELKWIGSNCPGTDATQSYSVICEMTQAGQLILTNPTVLGTGDATSVTLKVTKLAQ